MASSEHQWLALWAARKMVADGIVVVGFDGPAPQGGAFNILPKPSAVGAFRPDVSGYAELSRSIAYGEAKTEEDIDTPHTIDQLRSFAACASACSLYVAVPRSAAWRLDRVLAKASLPASTRVIRMHVPDCLVREPIDDYA